MLKEFIDKLRGKINKEPLQEPVVYSEPIEEKPAFEILLSQENNFFRMDISDYITITEYVERMEEIDQFGIRALVSNAVLWNTKKQKVNQGTFYIIGVGNRLYNILLAANITMIDERTKVEDSTEDITEDITEERIVWVDTANNNYRYTLYHHYGTDTLYTRYFSKRDPEFGKLELSLEEFIAEINSIIANMEGIEGIESIFDINLLREYILGDLGRNSNSQKV